MAFPTEPLGLRGELRIGTVWQNITGDLYTRDPITHTRGRPYQANAADPSALKATIRNLDGKYTPRNPEGPFFGLIGRGTPLRISLPGGPSTYLAMTGAADRATTPDTAALDLTGDLDVRWEGEADWYAPGAQILLGKWGAAGDRSWHVRIQNGIVYLHTTQDGTSGVLGGAYLPSQLPRRIALRAVVDVDNGSGGRTFTHYTAPSLDGPWTQIGTISGPGTVAVFAGTAPLSIAPAQDDPLRIPVAGKTYRAEVRNGIDGTIVAAPDFTAQPAATGGAFTDSAGRVWTLAADAEITDRTTRFEGEVPEWPAKWTPSAQDAWTPVEAAGMLRRLSQGNKPLQSPLRRRIPTYKPLAYWPMEEGANATQAYSPIEGVRPLQLTGAKWAQDSSLAASSPLPQLNPTATTECAMTGRIPAPSGTLTKWGVQFLFHLDQPNTTTRTLMRITTTGTVAEWYLQFSSGGSKVLGKDADGNTLVDSAWTWGAFPTPYGMWMKVEFNAVQNGSNTDWHLGWVYPDGTAAAPYGSVAGSIGRPKTVASPPNGYSTDLTGLALGHITVWPVDDNTGYENAITGWSGETAAARMTRLCREEGVPLTVSGTIADTAPMGPQTAKPLLDLLRECAEADGGLFGEALDRRELTYRTRADLYNQAPALTLDYAAGQIAPPFEPVDDDSVRNVWEVKRSGGSSGTAQLDEGPLSTLDPPDGIGLVADSATLNLAADDQTEPTANWLLHLTTWDEPRYPSVTLLLHRSPELRAAVQDLREGDKIRIINLPKQFTGSGTVELLVDGWTETLLPRAWTITYTCAPAGPWTVGAADDPILGIVDSGSTTLAADLDATATTFPITVGDGLLWTWETNFDVYLAGEIMTVTAVMGDVGDDFNRQSTAGWGTADTGQAWTTSGGSSTDYTITGG